LKKSAIPAVTQATVSLDPDGMALIIDIDDETGEYFTRLGYG
jgi:hypothetical protein